MPKYVVSKLIYMGHYEYIIRIQISPPGEKSTYSQTSYNKKNYSFEDVCKIRNRLLAEYESKGWRKTTGNYTSKTIDSVKNVCGIK
tara:strand:+ start:673 stop:930 length:258 start_codon:yes stop_codon:yes gene_type:complete